MYTYEERMFAFEEYFNFNVWSRKRKTDIYIHGYYNTIVYALRNSYLNGKILCREEFSLLTFIRC